MLIKIQNKEYYFPNDEPDQASQIAGVAIELDKALSLLSEETGITDISNLLLIKAILLYDEIKDLKIQDYNKFKKISSNTNQIIDIIKQANKNIDDLIAIKK